MEVIAKEETEMNIVTGLYLIFLLLFAVALYGFTQLDGDGSSLLTWISVGLFLFGTILYVVNKKRISN